MHVIILDENGDIFAFLEGYTKLEWTRKMRTFGSINLEINRRKSGADELIKGRFLIPVDEFFSEALLDIFLIEEIESQISEHGAITDILTVRGRSIDGIFKDRLALPPLPFSSNSHDSRTAVIETLLKEYADVNAGPSAATERQIPNLVIAADQARGSATFTVNARFNVLSELLEEITFFEDMGYEVTYDKTTNDYVFEVIPEDDVQTSVFFDIEFDTILSQKWLTSDLGTKTFAFVAGQGEGTARTIVERFIEVSEPTGFDRRELFIDARDVSTTAGLNARGDSKLDELKFEDVFEAEVNKFGSFRYIDDWNLNSIITIRNTNWGIQQAARVTGVRILFEQSLNSSQIFVELEKPFPSLKERILNVEKEDGTSRT